MGTMLFVQLDCLHCRLSRSGLVVAHLRLSVTAVQSISGVERPRQKTVARHDEASDTAERTDAGNVVSCGWCRCMLFII